MDDGNILNLKDLLERVDHDKELIGELFEIFLEDYEVKRRQLNEHVKKNNYQEVEFIAHFLKGSSANISANTLKALLAELEQFGQSKDLSKVKDLLLKIDNAHQELYERIKTIKSELL